ncbi:hypothetical protein [Desulfosporosinus sp. OT]|uniref:hypothetical protein n=1 Tax=Desulfosporosinus sp. OT TaxID=913865 RepID=UPI001A99D1F0|nr:hypothetical protein [Desulfosporosinus sp. OT]
MTLTVRLCAKNVLEKHDAVSVKKVAPSKLVIGTGIRWETDVSCNCGVILIVLQV